MPILSPQNKQTLTTRFKKELKRDVTLKLFTVRSAGLLVVPGRECPTCPQAHELAEEVASLSPKLHLEQVDFYTQAEEAQTHGIERVPCVTLAAEEGTISNLRFYGLPSGYEFMTLLEGIITLSKEVSPLRVPTRKLLRRLDQEVHLQVFVTPGCPHCPHVARLAYAMAMESPKVTADVIEAQEFPYLARSYAVRAVPKTVMNNVVEVVGAVSEPVFLQRLLVAAGQEELLAETDPATLQEPPGGPTTRMSG